MRMSRDSSVPNSSATLAKGSLGSLHYLRHYIAPHRLMVVCALLALLITSSSVLGLGYALRTLVDEGIAQGDRALLDRSFLLLFAVILLLAGTTYARYFLVSWIGERVVAQMRRDIYHHLLHLDACFFETHRTGELLSRITTDTTLIQAVVGSSVSVALRNILLLCGGLIMLFSTSIELTAYVLLIVPLVVTPIIIIGKKVRALSRATQDKIADLNVHAEETIYAIQTIQAFTLEERHEQQFHDHVTASLTTARARIAMRAQLTALVITLVLGAIATVLWIGGQNVLAGTMSAGELSSFVFYAVVVAGSTGAISEVIGDMQRAAGAVERLAEIKQTESTLLHTIPPVPLPDAPLGTLRFEDVQFFYPSRPDIPALNHISFTVERGETVAIVGASGSGKSTLFRMLLRYYDPASGKILCNDTPLHHYDIGALRQRMAVVSQDPMIFSASARENIALGTPHATMDAIRQAAHDAEILEFIEQLPQGFESYLGEKGIRLSGGQKQRISIARAIIRAPDLLLLDEATSALDSENERKVQEALTRVMQGRTTLVIAHRLATVRNADKILVMHDGAIDAVGTHDELFASHELYHTLAQQQFKAS